MDLLHEYLAIFTTYLKKRIADPSAWYCGRVTYTTFSPRVYRRSLEGPRCEWIGSVGEVEALVRGILPPGMEVSAQPAAARGEYLLEIRLLTGGRVPSWS